MGDEVTEALTERMAVFVGGPWDGRMEGITTPLPPRFVVPAMPDLDLVFGDLLDTSQTGLQRYTYEREDPVPEGISEVRYYVMNEGRARR